MRIRTLSKNIGKSILEYRAKFNCSIHGTIFMFLISEISSNFRVKLVYINIQWLGFILRRDPALRGGIIHASEKTVNYTTQVPGRPLDYIAL